MTSDGRSLIQSQFFHTRLLLLEVFVLSVLLLLPLFGFLECQSASLSELLVTSTAYGCGALPVSLFYTPNTSVDTNWN
jgi:hypothetical protein